MKLTLFVRKVVILLNLTVLASGREIGKKIGEPAQFPKSGVAPVQPKVEPKTVSGKVP